MEEKRDVDVACRCRCRNWRMSHSRPCLRATDARGPTPSAGQTTAALIQGDGWAGNNKDPNRIRAGTLERVATEVDTRGGASSQRRRPSGLHPYRAGNLSYLLMPSDLS